MSAARVMATHVGSRSEPELKRILEGIGLTVLVADDEAPIRTLVGRVLRDKGYEVLEAGDGIEALELAGRYDGPIHLLLTDWKMPRLGGGGLSRSLSNTRPETAVLIMSGHLDAEPPPNVALLPKPFTLVDLVRKVQDALLEAKPRANGTM